MCNKKTKRSRIIRERKHRNRLKLQRKRHAQRGAFLRQKAEIVTLTKLIDTEV